MSRRYIATLSELELLLLDYERVIVFGAGGICDNLIDYMKDHGNSFQIPFIVVTNRNADREKRGYPLYSLEELDDSEFTGALIIIATLEKHQEDISNSLEQRKFENVYALGERCAKQIRIWNMQYQYQMYNLRINSLQMLIAMEKQKEFRKYKNSCEGKRVAIIGNGPSLNKYKPEDDIVYIGVNYAIKREDIRFKYYFYEDFYGTIDKLNMKIRDFNEIRNKIEQDGGVVFGGNYMISSLSKTDAFESEPGIYKMPYSFENLFETHEFYIDYPIKTFPLADCATYPFYDGGTVVFPAIQFALYCNPSELYIVGCDSTLCGHFYDEDAAVLLKDTKLPRNEIEPYYYEGHIRIKRFADKNYPNTKIICINPVGLKGVYDYEVYT